MRTEQIVTLVSPYISIPHDPPQLIIIVGPCRTGTTSLSQTFLIPRAMQPIKSALRVLSTGDQVVPWVIENNQKYLLVKETLGVDSSEEFFNIIDVLISLGFPPSQIKLISIVRDPRATYDSQLRLFGEEKVKIEKLLRGFQLTKRTFDTANLRGITTIAYVHEVIRNNNPAVVIRNLYQLLGISSLFNTSAVDWSNRFDFLDDPEVSFFDTPPYTFIRGVQEGKGYCYTENCIYLSSQREQEIVESSELANIYQFFRHRCEQDFNLLI